jgi:hypothetical protein
MVGLVKELSRVRSGRAEPSAALEGALLRFCGIRSSMRLPWKVSFIVITLRPYLKLYQPSASAKLDAALMPFEKRKTELF